ncbi:MAG: MFS transporter [Dehalococcoidia bacterium]
MERTDATVAGRERPEGSARGSLLTRLSPAAWAARHSIHYGWVVVGVTFLTVLTAAGVRSTPAVLIRPLENEFGWSRGDISLALSLSLLTYGLAAPLSGRFTDRFGLRATTLLFGCVAAAGAILSIFLAHLWELHIFWGLIVGFGTGGIAVVMSATVANTWFETRRGLVTGVLGGASSAGQLVFLPLVVWVNSQWGWRTSIALLAVLLTGVVLPAIFLLMRSRPKDVGLEPYGTGAVGAPPIDTRTTPMRQALRTGDFWLLAMTFAICGFTTMGLIGTHFVPHAMEHGFTEAQAAGILSIIGGMNVVGTIASGWLTDRFSARKLLAGYYFFRALSLLALPLVTTLPLMSVFAVVYGFDYIATVPPTVMLTADRFGRRSVGTIFGWISFSHMAGGALGAAAAGLVHDAVGTYTTIIYTGGFLALLAAALAFNVRSRRAAPVLASA